MGDRAHLRQLRRDRARSGNGVTIAYSDEKGVDTTLIGNDDGPYVVPVTDVLIDATTSATGETSRALAGEYFLVEAAGYNNSLILLYLMVFDAVELPANGTVPLFTAVPVTVGDTTALDIDGGTLVHKGIVVAFSTTPLAFTLGPANAGSLSIFYRPDA